MTPEYASPMTAEQLFALPDDGLRHELIAGVRSTKPLEGIQHGIVAANVCFRLGSHCTESGAGLGFSGGTGFQVGWNPDSVRTADFAIVSSERAREIRITDFYFSGVPDLAVEVISADDLAEEVEEKIHMWLSAGCREVWEVCLPSRTVTLYHSLTEIHVFAGDQTIDQSRVLPQFRCPVPDIFAGLK